MFSQSTPFVAVRLLKPLTTAVKGAASEDSSPAMDVFVVAFKVRFAVNWT